MGQSMSVRKRIVEGQMKSGRRLWTLFKIFLKVANGVHWVLFLLVICVLVTYANYFCLDKLFTFLQDSTGAEAPRWGGLGLLWGYFLAPVSLVLLRTGLVSHFSVKFARALHHELMLSILYGELHGFYEHMDTAGLYGMIMGDINKLDKTSTENVSRLFLFSGFVVSDMVVAVITVNGWILLFFLVYFVLVFYYQNLSIRLRRDLSRLQGESRDSLDWLSHDILDGKTVIRTLQKRPHVLRELCRGLDANSVNLTTLNALNNWFSLRISLLNVLLVQLPLFAMMVAFAHFQMISVRKIVLVLPICLNFAFNADMWTIQMTQLETLLAFLENTIELSRAPSEPNYFKLGALKRVLCPSKMARIALADLVTPSEPALRKSHPEAVAEEEGKQGARNQPRNRLQPDQCGALHTATVRSRGHRLRGRQCPISEHPVGRGVRFESADQARRKSGHRGLARIGQNDSGQLALAEPAPQGAATGMGLTQRPVESEWTGSTSTSWIWRSCDRSTAFCRSKWPSSRGPFETTYWWRKWRAGHCRGPRGTRKGGAKQATRAADSTRNSWTTWSSSGSTRTSWQRRGWTSESGWAATT